MRDFSDGYHWKIFVKNRPTVIFPFFEELLHLRRGSYALKRFIVEVNVQFACRNFVRFLTIDVNFYCIPIWFEWKKIIYQKSPPNNERFYIWPNTVPSRTLNTTETDNKRNS